MRTSRSAAGLLPGCLLFAAMAPGETPRASPAAVTGIFNWIHSSADIDRGYAFYQQVFGLEMVNPGFGNIPGAPPPKTIRARSEAIADPVIGNLTNTGSARFRNVFIGLPGAGFGLELSEFNDIESRTIRPNFWDPGATSLSLAVRDIDAVTSALRKVNAPIVTLSAAPVGFGRRRRSVRAILARDPDGYLLEIEQASPAIIASTHGSAPVVGAAIGLAVGDLAQELKFYRDILGFDIATSGGFHSRKSTLDLLGLRTGRLRVSSGYIPGTRVAVNFYEFRDVTGTPIRLRIQDPGAPQLQLRVRDLDPLMQRVKDAGYTFVSVGGKPIQRAFGRFVFVLDPNGMLVEFVHPAAPLATPQAP